MLNWNGVAATTAAIGLVSITLTLSPAQRRRTPAHSDVVTAILSLCLVSAGVGGMTSRQFGSLAASTCIVVAALGVSVSSRILQPRSES